MAFWPSLSHAFLEVFAAPFKAQLWWQLLPLLVLWVVVELYLGFRRGEELGWNTALGNAISLFWMVLAATQPLFHRAPVSPFPYDRFFLLLGIIAYALFLGYASFMHRFSSRVTYAFAAPSVVFFLAFFAVLWGNGALALNRWVLLAVFLLWLFVLGARWFFFWLSARLGASSS